VKLDIVKAVVCHLIQMKFLEAIVEMIEVSVKHMKESGMLKEQNKTEEEAREFMYSFFPKLKRWECTCTEECASGYNPNCTCTSSECHCTEKPD